MNIIVRVLVVLFVITAFSTANAQTTTIVDLRIGMQSQATYHLVEAFQNRGRWTFPDVGTVDFGASDYREWFVGVGYKILDTKHVSMSETIFFVQAVGPAADQARYIQLSTGIQASFTPQLSGEAAFFPYIPLNSAGTRQWVVERAKVEYIFATAFKAGGGYGAYQFGNEKWRHQPFLTTTFSPAEGKFGSWEFWYQRLPEGKQVQIRFELAHTGK
jgi:hypothetical protein